MNSIDFNTLKYNLYDILGVEKDVSNSKIKQAYKNLVLMFHPDKNNSDENEIYNYIVIANQVLSNKENRQQYDTYLNDSSSSHDNLKSNFNKQRDLYNHEKITNQQFKTINDELNDKYLKSSIIKSIDLDIKNINYDELIKNRNNEINIIKNENIRNMGDFNNTFDNKIFNNEFNNELISYEENTGLSTYNVNDNYTSLNVAFGNLFVDGGGVSTSNYTSLDSAFKLQKRTPFNEKTIDERMKEYNDFTSVVKNNQINFSKEVYNQYNDK